MHLDDHLIFHAVPPGSGLALDLGGGEGVLRKFLESCGYRYVNLDLKQPEGQIRSVLGDAHLLPFSNSVFNLVVSKDSLEHFLDPPAVVGEVHRVLKEKGYFVIWVPFIHPFHGDDYWRFTPLGLKRLLGNFQIRQFESPLWLCTVMGTALLEFCRSIGLPRLESPIKRVCYYLDRLLLGQSSAPRSFAAAYLILAQKNRKDFSDSWPTRREKPQPWGSR